MGPGITFELFPRPRQTFALLSGPFNCADYSLRRAWNTTRRLHQLSPDRTASYGKLFVRKLAPTVPGDRPTTHA